MSNVILAINPTTAATGSHDPSAALFKKGDLVFAVEEERFNRRKHSMRTFPRLSIEACLKSSQIKLSDLDSVVVSWNPKEKAKRDLRLDLEQPNIRQKAYNMVENVKDYSVSLNEIQNKLANLGQSVPPIETYNHHRCHAASAFAPSGFDEALVVTIDGRGERESTVVWKGTDQKLTRIKTYTYPNSLGAFFGSITVYLGYRLHNGEGKIMGLAPYGNRNDQIEQKLLTLIESGADYDVSALNYHTDGAISKLEELFNKPKKSDTDEFSDWEQDLAYVSQRFVEKTVVDIIEKHCREQNLSNVALSGGVALNCKMNKCVMESAFVEDLYIQPVAHDAGSAIGAGILRIGMDTFDEMSTVYWGPGYSESHIKEILAQYKLDYRRPEDLEQFVAERISDGELVGWFQGRTEMGPRALGNRSILADPRSIDSRDRVNKFVKHREEWRPFAPSLLEEAADDYLRDATAAPYMIRTFDIKEAKSQEIPAVLHPADKTTRPQTVNENQNPRYHKLLREFERITGVPVVLNTSFNDSGEPIVNTPTEAIKDFFGMGLDLLVLEDLILEKPT